MANIKLRCDRSRFASQADYEECLEAKRAERQGKPQNPAPELYVGDDLDDAD